jgi:hypothetical protein
MMNFRVWCALGIYLAVAAAANASDPSQTCSDMYPEDSYAGEERYQLIQECIQNYSTDSGEGSSSADSSYYEGTVEDYVNQIPAEEPPSEEPPPSP